MKEDEEALTAYARISECLRTTELRQTEDAIKDRDAAWLVQHVWAELTWQTETNTV
jgi:hypothetical protein